MAMPIDWTIPQSYLNQSEEIAALRARVAELEGQVTEIPTLFRRLEARVAELEGWLEERGLCVACGDSNEWQDGDQGADGLCMPCYAKHRLARQEGE